MAKIWQIVRKMPRSRRIQRINDRKYMKIACTNLCKLFLESEILFNALDFL